MTYTKKQFLADVAIEAKAIKKNATTEEVRLLDFTTFRPDHKTRCIYGQMTGNCRSDRARELIGICCPRYVVNDFNGQSDFKYFSRIKQSVDGEKVELEMGEIDFLSMIESYILRPTAKAKNLIAYLKDETKELVL